MMKTDTVFKRAFNDTADLLARLSLGEVLASQSGLARELGVSRTTMRKVLAAMTQHGVLVRDGRGFRVKRRTRLERYPSEETVPLSAQVEQQFMEWVRHNNIRPGATINELELTRQFGMATSGIREFLNRFQRFRLIEKRPNAGWVFKGFTPSFAQELFEIREMFELRSARAFARLPSGSPLWTQLDQLRIEHEECLADMDRRYRDFSDLDSRFHRLINDASPNRFIDGFYDIITLIFHYHYQWNKRDERTRNEVAVREHLTYIAALLTRNPAIVDLACRAHLASARETLLRSTAIDAAA